MNEVNERGRGELKVEKPRGIERGSRLRQVGTDSASRRLDDVLNRQGSYICDGDVLLTGYCAPYNQVSSFYEDPRIKKENRRRGKGGERGRRVNANLTNRAADVPASPPTATPHAVIQVYDPSFVSFSLPIHRHKAA